MIGVRLKHEWQMRDDWNSILHARQTTETVGLEGNRKKEKNM